MEFYYIFRFLILYSITILWNFSVSFGQENESYTAVKLLILRETDQDYVVKWFEEEKQNLKTEDVRVEYVYKTVSDDENENEKLCANMSSQQVSMILDVTWSGSEEAKILSNNLQIPYAKLDVSISPALSMMDAYLKIRNVTNVAVIFEKESDIDQALYYWINKTRLRMIVMEGIDTESAARLKNIHPHPHNYAIVAHSANVSSLFQKAISENLVELSNRWNLVYLDFENYPLDFKINDTDYPINVLRFDKNLCCSMLKLEENCQCPSNFILEKITLQIFLQHLMKMFTKMIQDKISGTISITCDSSATEDATNQPKVKEYFDEELDKVLLLSDNFYNDQGAIRLKIKGVISMATTKDDIEDIATYDSKSCITILPGKAIKPIKNFYRIGTAYAIPWSFQEKDPVTGEMRWTGYCLDLIKRMSEVLDFDYEIVIPKNGSFGEKDSYGKWDGIVGDLARGETDIAVAALIMTADREEVVDFVTPYFEESGISIVMRKPVRKTSLFKFMTVLRLEVWLSIVAALIVTGFMIWFLDKYSPYSARNNKKAYPYPCREFTLKESFWFALTSFTPQGGGEAPKALSGRTLVAAYWLFVVLMLATFTANLAAFLTVERMQSPVQSLEQLARQSRINYTVVMESEVHEYFINMKNAEDTLYRMWKELTLNASTEEKQYRVWDYPIKEQYGHILSAINESMPVASAEEGFKKVDERLDADFAFIHDSSEIKYEISKNCNFTEVGEVFAEKPYAIAIQQGSFLQDTLSKLILDLQKDRFFDELKAKYWNNSIRGVCPDTDESEGITLDSLGGVFIATLFGLALAMVTLAGEVIYYRRKQSDKVQPDTTKKDLQGPIKTITLGGSTFKPVLIEDKKKKINNAIPPSYFTVYPRNRLPQIN